MNDLLSIGKKALQVSLKNLDVTGQNIANINTDGYSRQRVVQTAAEPSQNALAFHGNGVNIQRIERVRDERLDTEFRKENSNYNYWKKMSDELSQLEMDLQEPSDYGLSANLNNFWDKWDELANLPHSEISRESLKAAAEMLINSFHNLDTHMVDRKKNLNTELENIAEDINSISKQLADLNRRIVPAEAAGKQPNDLLDKFDKLIDDLSQYGETRVKTRKDGKRIVYFGTDEIVDSSNAREVAVKLKGLPNERTKQLVWKEGFDQVNTITKGEVAAIVNLRDNVISGYEDKLDRLAASLAEKINSIHREGYNLSDNPTSGHNFFDEDTTGAGNIELSSEIKLSVDNIAASLEGEEGDNRIALQISKLRDADTIDEKMSFGDYYGAFLTNVGNDAHNSYNRSEALKNSSQQIDEFRQNVKGVSIDEESANLLKYQQAYMAAAKVMTVADKALATVINLIN